MKQKDKDFKIKDQAMWLIHDMRNLLQEVYDHYRSVKLENEYLQEENARLKSEAYKDEELDKMKKEYDKMKTDYYRGFYVTEEESKRIEKWMKEITKGEDFQTKVGGAIGGRFTYKFIPTSIGTVGVVKDGKTNEEFKFRDLA